MWYFVDDIEFVAELICDHCHQAMGPVDYDEFAYVKSRSELGEADICLNCAGEQEGSQVDNPFFLCKEGEYLTFREDQPECYLEKGTRSGYTDMLVQEAKYISIKVTNGLFF